MYLSTRSIPADSLGTTGFLGGVCMIFGRIHDLKAAAILLKFCSIKVKRDSLKSLGDRALFQPLTLN